MVFLDTNVLVYAALNQDPHKHAKAAQIVRDLLASDSGAAVTLTRLTAFG